MTGFAAALYQNLPFPALIVDAQGCVVSHNESAARAFGWNREGRKPDGLIIIDGADVAATLARHASTGRENVHPFSFRHDNGSVFDATAHVICVPEDGIGACYAILLRSLLSGGSHGEQILLGQRVNAALDTLPEGFAVFDENERLVMFNRTFRDRCGPARESVRVGATLESIIHSNLNAGSYSGIRAGTPEGEVLVAERLREHRTPDTGGTVFPYGDGLWMRAESHVAETGDIVALRVDVTELKRTEAALEEKRREYLSLLQVLPDMILRFDRNLIVRFANDNYASHVGASVQDLIGRYLPDISCAPEESVALMRIENYTRDEPVRTLELCIDDHGGNEMWMHWTAVATFDEHGVSEIVTVGRDITEAKRQQHQVEAQTRELRRKNEALDQFTATVSHDLKAPLRHLSMFAEMISEDLHRGNVTELPHYADHVRKSAMRMRRIIDSLLEFSQIAYRITSPKPVALYDVVRDALVLLEGHVQETGGTVETRALPEIMGDPELLKRLAQNLIGNALKYCSPGGKPVVRVYGGSGPDGLQFIVEDDGIGIDPQHVERIFDVFQRLHRDETVYQGTGVGLALARRIVESHNGVIALDTTYGPGARFVVTFPHPAKAKGSERGRPA